MFSFISMNWKGQPLINFETMVNMISATKTKSGLKIKAFLDRKDYKTGIKISDKQMKNLNLKFHDLHPQWNYTIYPRSAQHLGVGAGSASKQVKKDKKRKDKK